MATVTVGDTGSGTLNTVITVDFPVSYDSATDDFVVIYSRNNAGSQTFGSNVTATEISNDSGRLGAYRIVPDTDSETDFTITGTSSFWSWALLKISNADLDSTIESVGNEIGNNTTSNIEMSLVELGYVATGNEILISAGSVNSTASWTTTGNTIYNTTSGNAALMIEETTTSAGDITATASDMDRGNDTVTRLENELSFVIQVAPTGTNNILTNASFELGATIGTDWVDESSVVGTPTYSLTTTNVSDGAQTQRVEYAGVGGDSTGKVQFYQSSLSDGWSVGDTVQFDVWISGSMTNAYGLIGVEAFEADTSYISDVSTSYVDADIDPSTPAKFTVQYTIPPLSDYLAVFMQFPAFPETGDIDVYFDKATLTNLGVLSQRRIIMVT